MHRDSVHQYPCNWFMYSSIHMHITTNLIKFSMLFSVLFILNLLLLDGKPRDFGHPS